VPGGRCHGSRGRGDVVGHPPRLLVHGRAGRSRRRQHGQG
jgi:hypothetical protein